MSRKVLILDDEPKMGALLTRSLAREGYDVNSTDRPADALEVLKQDAIDVLLTDLRMPDMDGLEVLKRAKEISPQTEVVLMTAFASVETAREALTRGALDYLVKPVSADNDLKPLLEKVFSTEAASASSRSTASVPSIPTGEVSNSEVEFIGDSPAIASILKKVPKIASSAATVLLRGESGTGKEVMADLIQSKSDRSDKPFVKVNCGALAETLLESELFGHVKGSFTGAHADRSGMFEAANGGTLMLDEVGEVSLALQVKLLRVLQSGDYTPVGETRARKCDVRVIAATNRPLEEMVEKGEFRQDLYYRLNVVPLELPPLRERPEDLDSLIELFCTRFSKGSKVNFAADALEALRGYQWPGNIRELENAIEHALVFGDPEQIELDDLPVAMQQWKSKQASATGAQSVGSASLEEIEMRCLMTALEKTHGNRTKAAKLLGITRRTLGYRLKKYDLEEEVSRRFDVM